MKGIIHNKYIRGVFLIKHCFYKDGGTLLLRRANHCKMKLKKKKKKKKVKKACFLNYPDL